ncbi:MAG: glutathione S-transferase family protein [Rhodanobacter sp.]|jgi:glutathione S-transferase
MKLYSFSGSCALGANIVLEWIGQPYELQLLQKNDLASPAIRALNPNGQVPILVDDGWALNENAAILNYLADKFPAAKLGGEPTPRGRAEVNRWLAMINSDVHPAFKPLFGATSYLGDEAMIEKSKDAARQQLRTWFERLDKHLEGRDWLAGERSIADPYLFVTLRWTHAVNVDLGSLANLQAFERRMRADPGVQRALKMQKLDQPHA